ncbi:MAG: hypothetical protein IPM82_26710 [Saprospiraceae bacterium]|nr:hypothetical protein [Saprospiraceae bacterium]
MKRPDMGGRAGGDLSIGCKSALTLVKEGVSIGTTIINEDGSLWGVGQNQAHFHWDGEKATLLPDDFHAVMQFARDKQGHIWAVRPDSLFGMDLKNSLNTQPTPSAHKGIFFRWAPDIPATGYPMASLAIDNSGIIWVGSNGYGLYQINPNQTRFTHLCPAFPSGILPSFLRTNIFCGPIPVGLQKTALSCEWTR